MQEWRRGWGREKEKKQEGYGAQQLLWTEGGERLAECYTG